MPSNYDSRSRGRPLGITILCVLGFLGVFFSFVGMLDVIGRGGPSAVIGLAGLALVVAKESSSPASGRSSSGATSGESDCTPSLRFSTS
ncbi:hypothetical protein [Halorussus aquaticus]|uniref:hypothetical protein n=1 Tax=Halorussus aquaticus TaxID=2953748 RepID=UPI0020B6CFB9|nr:hypothetical protein [Halorussus aquaticus]